MSTYKDLKVWQLNQVCLLETLTLMELLPRKYAYEHIAKQLFRAISSIGANLAEGHSNYQGKEFNRYIEISLNSAVEADHWITTLLNLSNEYKVKIDKLADINLEVIKMLKGLGRSILQKRNSEELSLNTKL